MYLVLFLHESLAIELLDEDVCVLRRDGRTFVDICEDWSSSLYLGFYDWLRSPDSDVILGVDLILHDGREGLREIVPRRRYIEWLSAYIMRVRFQDGTIDEECSVDQEFSASRCLQADDGSVALIFDAIELSFSQLQQLERAQAYSGS